MNFIKTIIAIVTITFILSACKKNASCPSVTLCPSVNPIYFAVNGTDTAFLYVPNAFTPNGDGLNDDFRLFAKNINITNGGIYDGNTLVFQIGTTTYQWNGLINGQQHVNIYTVKIAGQTSWGAPFTLNGTVSDINGALLGDGISITTNTFLDIANARFESQFAGYNGFNPAINSNENIIADSVIVCH